MYKNGQKVFEEILNINTQQNAISHSSKDGHGQRDK